jgi:hypothetical protein
MKKLAKNEAAIAEQMQKSLMWQIEKERLESVNEW